MAERPSGPESLLRHGLRAADGAAEFLVLVLGGMAVRWWSRRVTRVGFKVNQMYSFSSNASQVKVILVVLSSFARCSSYLRSEPMRPDLLCSAVSGDACLTHHPRTSFAPRQRPTVFHVVAPPCGPRYKRFRLATPSCSAFHVRALEPGGGPSARAAGEAAAGLSRTLGVAPAGHGSWDSFRTVRVVRW